MVLYRLVRGHLAFDHSVTNVWGLRLNAVLMLLVSYLLFKVKTTKAIYFLVGALTSLLFENGIKINLAKKTFRYYLSILEIPIGVSKPLKPYTEQVILVKRYRRRIPGPVPWASPFSKEMVEKFHNYLVTPDHRNRVFVQSSLDSNRAEEIARVLETELKIPLRVFNPEISDRTKIRKALERLRIRARQKVD